LINLFQEKFSKADHPVWLLLGDIEECLATCKETLTDEYIIEYFEQSSIYEMRHFFLSYGIKPKIAVCTINNPDKTAALLKILEDVKPLTKIVLIGPSVPDVLRNRAVVVEIRNTLNPAKQFVESFGDKLLEYYLAEDIEVADAGYATYQKLLDFVNSEINSNEAIDRMRSIIRCAGLEKEFL